MTDPKGVFIPKGMTETLVVEIADQIATFKFNNSNVTKRFVMFEREASKKAGDPLNTVYIERVQKAITKYEGKTKEEIKEIIIKQLKQFGVNAKNIE